MNNYPPGMSVRDLQHVGEIGDGYDFQCVRCDKYLRENEVIDVNGDDWCQLCSESFAVQCSKCKRLFVDEEDIEVHEEEDHAPLG